MIIKLIDQIIARFSHQPILLHNIQLLPTSNVSLKLQDIFDGFLLATPKHRTPIRKIWSRKYGNDNWRFGTKLFKPKRNIITCTECGSFHEVHTICKVCFNDTQEKSKKAIEIKANTLWFDTNLVQPAAQSKKILDGSPTVEPLDNTVKVKE